MSKLIEDRLVSRTFKITDPNFYSSEARIYDLIAVQFNICMIYYQIICTNSLMMYLCSDSDGSDDDSDEESSEEKSSTSESEDSDVSEQSYSARKVSDC